MERWGLFEVSVNGLPLEKPFLNGRIEAEFVNEKERVKVNGFYDGDNTYKVRFMPSFEGRYEYRIMGNCLEKSISGEFWAVTAKKENHGPVRLCGRKNFSYADGTPFYPVGTTSYAWIHQKEEMRKSTLQTLKHSPFNKLRFCVFPKYFIYNREAPEMYPFQGHSCDLEKEKEKPYTFQYGPIPGNDWEYDSFCPEFFKKLDDCIVQLGNYGIEADLILFHPYDIWGFSCMDEKTDERYVKYMIARYGAYRHVWWSLANEYDCIRFKTVEDWERLGRLLMNEDVYGHLRSIHNCSVVYDQSSEWITHCCMQRTNIYQGAQPVLEWTEAYDKPVIFDECGYEGNLPYSWGNLSAKELVKLFWMTAVRGGYCGHGETYLSKNDNEGLWWSHGGVLKGESWKRIAFYSEIMKKIPGLGLKPVLLPMFENDSATAAEADYQGKFYLCYCTGCPAEKEFCLEAGVEYVVEIVDTWEMTIRNKGVFEGTFTVKLPEKEGMLIRVWEKSVFEERMKNESGIK